MAVITRIRPIRSKPRKERVRSIDFLNFIHQKPCLLAGITTTLCNGWITAHHVREFGGPLNDFRTVPLCMAHHLHDFGRDSIERLGKRQWQKRFGVDLEAEIRRLNTEYERMKA